jgi:hypothetical protein
MSDHGLYPAMTKGDQMNILSTVNGASVTNA